MYRELRTFALFAGDPSPVASGFAGWPAVCSYWSVENKPLARGVDHEAIHNDNENSNPSCDGGGRRDDLVGRGCRLDRRWPWRLDAQRRELE